MNTIFLLLAEFGQADVPVPAQYRHRVSEYFQRVSDEMSQ